MGRQAVATFDAQGDFALDEVYSGSDVDLSQIVSASAWRTAADELATLIDAQGIPYDLGGTIPNDGFTSFGNLTPGLYLVRGSGLTNGSAACSCFSPCSRAGAASSRVGKMPPSPIYRQKGDGGIFPYRSLGARIWSMRGEVRELPVSRL